MSQTSFQQALEQLQEADKSKAKKHPKNSGCFFVKFIVTKRIIILELSILPRSSRD